MVDKYKVALPLHPEWGTKPNVFYVPTTAPPKLGSDGRLEDQSRIPLAYLESLFGDGVQQAFDTIAAERAKKTNGEDSELMDTLIGYKHSEMFKLS